MTWIRKKIKGFWNSIKTRTGKMRKGFWEEGFWKYSWNSLKAFLSKMAGRVIALFLKSPIARLILCIFTRFLNCRIWNFILYSPITIWILKRTLYSSFVVNRKIIRIFTGFLNWVVKKDPIQFMEDKHSRDEVTLELAEELLEIIIYLMKVTFKINPDFRKNIEDFEARYQFRSADESPGKSIAVVVEFKGGDVDFEERKKPIIGEELEREKIDATVIFKHGQALLNYMLLVIRGEKGMLRMLIKNELVIVGNDNYLMKFQYLINHFLLAFTGRLT